MILKEIFPKCDFEKAFEILATCWEEQRKNKEGYENVWEVIQTLEPRIDTNSKMELEVFAEEEDGIVYYCVHGVEPDAPYPFALQYDNWQNWVGYSISQKTLEEFEYEQILAACLYEMTFNGFTQEEVFESGESLKKALSQPVDLSECVDLKEFLNEIKEVEE